jgi:DNA-binding CsgD family transcriptional regulator
MGGTVKERLGGRETLDQLQHGRESYTRCGWGEAYTSLSIADGESPLAPEDLELLAKAAYLTARDDDCLAALRRAHHAYVDAGATVSAARCAFWLGFRLMSLGEMGQATGWLARAHRLLEHEERDCVERGYLQLPLVLQHLATGGYEAARVTAAQAVESGESFGEPDLIEYARHLQGRALLKLGRIDEGLALLDEAMVAVVAGELSPLVTGLIYCSVIEGCQEVFELRRAEEWTVELTHWCEQQPGLVTYTGSCLVHRAEIMLMRGAWHDAIEEARRAGERIALGADPEAAGAALYLEGEGRRLLGEFDNAEDAYRGASHAGWEPQPGLALLRLAQGNIDAAASAIRRVLGETAERLARARVLPAAMEILLAAGDIEGAADACSELEKIAELHHVAVFDATAAQGRGALEVAGGNPRAALPMLRRAGQAWQELGSPYESARVRVLVGRACRALGDDDSATLELEAARTAFERLGAAPDISRIDALTPGDASPRTGGLTPRELQVLRLVAAAKTNRAIATQLFLSEKTVERHLSSIFTKLDLSSRAGATAYAYENQLV